MEPGGPAEIGRDTIYANDVKQSRQSPEVRVTQYKADIRSVKRLGKIAVEWGYFSGAVETSPSSPADRFSGKVLRVLELGPDGCWRFSHVAWNETK